MNLELNTLMVAVFFAPMTLLVLGNVLEVASTGYQVIANSRPSPRPVTVAPRATFEAANEVEEQRAA